jgi:nucleotide-binding universal stress UspA family protein
VHIVEDISGRLSGLPNVPVASFDFGRWQREALNVGQEKVGSLLSDEDRQKLGATAVALLARSAAPALLDYAKEHGIDLIVAGTHGRGAIGHLFMGNVAERLVRRAACPVLTVRHPEHELVLPDALQSVARHA